MTRPIALALALATSGCYQVSTIEHDAGASDATAAPDVIVTSCPRWGDTIGCDSLCAEPCPELQRCRLSADICTRSREACVPIAGSGWRRFCSTGRPCALASDEEAEPGHWDSGYCVSAEFCRHVQSGGSAAFELCRYSDGTLFVDGPPDHECAPGAEPESPFCGGRCGDTCLGEYAACVGVSEDRGFGMCTRNDFKCDVESLRRGVSLPFDQCESSWESVSDECACFVPSPAVRPEFEGLHGWMVSLQTCLAYRERYPDHVSCLLRGGNEAR